MSQLDICRLRSRDTLVCVIQTDIAVDTAFLLCAPVVKRSQWGMLVPSLHLSVAVDDEPHVIVMTQLVSLPSRDLGETVGSVPHLRDEIVRAVDLLVVGF